jgi:SAM-dependent methyltransferase
MQESISSIRLFARHGRQFLTRSRARLLRKLGLITGDWKGALSDELAFWEWSLKDGGRNWDPGEWTNATDPNRELQEELKALIPAGPGDTVRILDVGSGPLTRVGKRWEGRKIQIVPTDPLADQYNELLSRLKIQPLVAAVNAQGEKLLERFPANSFDLAYASNSLDHSCDPVLVMQQMLAVVKPGRFVYLWHAANEAIRHAYQGLHQWNFDIRHGEFVLGDGRKVRSVNEALSRQAEVSCEFQRAFNTRIVVAKLRKREPV